MNQPHKHAEVIKAWADGADIEFSGDGSTWVKVENPRWDLDCEYRVKPEPEYPKTSLSGDELFSIHAYTNDTAKQAFVRVANHVIKQAIIDGDVIINPNKQK